jgi:hypothetical protein
MIHLKTRTDWMKKLSSHTILYRALSYKKYIMFFLFFIFVFLFTFSTYSKSADAYLEWPVGDCPVYRGPFSGDVPSGWNMPLDVYFNLNRADCNPQSPTVSFFATMADNFTGLSTSVPYGTASINLAFHGAATVGWSPSSAIYTRYSVVGASSGVSGIVGEFVQTDLSGGPNTRGYSSRALWNTFNYAPAGGFTASGNYPISLTVKVAQTFNNRGPACVANGTPAINITGSNCPNSLVVFNINVTVSNIPVRGCTDPAATNYNPNASVDDGSCVYPPPPLPLCSLTPVPVNAATSTYRLEWTTNNAVSGSIAGIGAMIPISIGNTSNFVVSTTTTYIGTVVNSSGQRADCSATVNISPVLRPTCSVGPVGNNLGEEITFSVNVINNDSTRNITITQANWSSTGGTTPLNGTGAPLGLVSPGGNSTITSGNVTLNAIGTFQFNWTINISSPTGTFTLTGDDCGTAAARTFSPASSPYSRVYGGDVFAGGGIRTANGSCTPNAGADALGFMKGNSNATFAGTGTDLAVFAADLITGVQSRSMSQLSPAYLAFSNQFSVNIPSYSFGGGFNTTNACTRDYYADRSGTALPSVGTINISNLASGSYTVGNGGTIFLTSPSLPNARRVVVYVNGDAYLQPQGPGNKFGYLNNEWADRSQVPSIYIIASGSIFIDGDITQLDGVFIAQPTAASPNTTGEISTCAKNSGAGRELSNFTTPSVVDHLKANCTRKLTVNGAFIAKQVHLLRHLASVSQAVNSEPSSSPNISEVFNYSPELFLTQGGGIPRSNRNVQIDSLVALPPVF